MAVSKRKKDWQDNKSLSECMMYMLEKEIMCDVTFRVGTDQSIIKAHKYMLSSRSPVFYTMFKGSWKTVEVVIPDITSATFKVLLQYIYSDVLDISPDNVYDVLYVAEKYMLSTLKTKCVVLLSSYVETSNAPLVYDVAVLFYLMHLKQKSLKHIQENTTDCLIEPDAIEMSKECLEAILRLDFIYCSETDLCRFLLKWARHRCHTQGNTVQGVLGSLLCLIRFHLVDREYFVKQIAQSGLLTLTETISVLSKDDGQKNNFFSKSTRKLYYSVFHHSCVSSGKKNEENDFLRISVNVNIMLKAVILYGPIGEMLPCSERRINITIKNDSECLHKQEHESCTNKCEIQTVYLSKPINMKKDEKYTLMIDSPSFYSYFGTECKPVRKIDNITVQFEKCKRTNGTNVEQGQIAGIVFNAIN